MSLLPRRLICSQGMGIVLGLLALAAARAQNAADTPFQITPLAQRQPLTVGAFTDAYPYSYLDADGHLAGFSVDVLDAVAKAVNLQITRVLGPAVQIRQRFQNGEFEMLQYHGITQTPVPYAEFSVPYLSLQGCIFVRDGGPIKHLQDLNGQEFGMIGTTGEGEKLLRDNHVRARIVPVASQENLLERISSGEIAGGFVSQLSELSVARRQHIKNIVMLGRPYNGYEIRQAFAVHASDAELLARLNEGLAIVHRSGEYDRIYRKNFSQYGSFILSSDELELYISITLAFGFVVVLWGYFRQRRLRQELSVQTARLADQGALLQALYDNIPMAMTVIETGTTGPVVLSMNRESCSLYAIDFTARGEPLDALDVSPEIRQLLAQAAGRTPGADLVSKREVTLKSGKRILEVTSSPWSRPRASPRPGSASSSRTSPNERSRSPRWSARGSCAPSASWSAGSRMNSTTCSRLSC